ncbi:MAG: hypothetical protein JWQ41_2361 [Variovorax sp.]|nr:hypothetical protein [Variovorax sp.]
MDAVSELNGMHSLCTTPEAAKKAFEKDSRENSQAAFLSALTAFSTSST